MGTVRKIGDEYFIEFSARGLLYQQKAGTNHEAAQRLLQEVESKIAHGELSAIVRDVDYDIFFHNYEEYAATIHTPVSLQRYRDTIKSFQDFLKEEYPSIHKLSGVTPRVIEQYKNFLLKKSVSSRLLSGKVINFTLFLLSDVFKFAIKLGYLNDDPTLHIRLVEMLHVGRLRTISLKEKEQFAQKASLIYGCIMELILLTGARLEEICQLKTEDISVEKNILRLRAINARYLGEREIPMTLRTLEVLKGFQMEKEKRDGQGLTPQKLYSWLEEFKSKYTIYDGIGWSSFRHTFAVHLIEKKVPLANFSKMMGFCDIGMTTAYMEYLKDHWGVGR